MFPKYSFSLFNLNNTFTKILFHDKEETDILLMYKSCNRELGNY